MLNIIVVEDNENKKQEIKKLIESSIDIPDEKVDYAMNVKSAKQFIYKKSYDFMILDLVLPLDEDDDPKPQNGIGFLNDIHSSPQIKPVTHIVGLTGFSEFIDQYKANFENYLWHLIDYKAEEVDWKEKLKTLIFHLIRTRLRFLESPKEQISAFFSRLKDQGFPDTFLGNDWVSVCQKLCNIIERSLETPSKFKNASRAQNINNSSLIISSEYDFQNLIHLIIRPWIPSLEAENIAIVFDGNTKNADFSINQNSIIIEAKYIDKNGKKNDVIKTIEGLKSFYKKNSNVKALIFLILVENIVIIDKYKIEDEYNNYNKNPIVHLSILENKLK